MKKPYPQRLFTPINVLRYDFVLEDVKRGVTVIIAPIKLVEFEDRSPGVSFACSRGQFYHDPYYRYSKIEKETKRTP